MYSKTLNKKLNNKKWLAKNLKYLNKRNEELELIKKNFHQDKSEGKLAQVTFFELQMELNYVKRKIFQLEKYYT